MPMNLVMTMIGLDRPGLVDSVAGVVVAHNGNWLESRMSHLGGHFAGILRIELDPEKQEAFTRAVQGLEAQGLTVVVHVDSQPPSARPSATAVLDVVGQDRPGIVSQISHALALQSVNVEELQTERINAPMSGEWLFTARARLQLPEQCRLDELRLDLEKIAADLMVDLSLVEPSDQPEDARNFEIRGSKFERNPKNAGATHLCDQK